VRALGYPLADALQPAGALEVGAPAVNQGVTGEELQQDGERDEGEADPGAEADAGGDVQEAGGKPDQRQHDEQGEGDAGVEPRGLGMHGLDLELAVEERGERTDHERHRRDLAPRQVGELERRQPAATVGAGWRAGGHK